MTPVQRKRTIRFIKYLEKLSHESFYIGLVCSRKGLFNKDNFTRSLKEHDCGTTACAIGHLPLFSPTVFEYKFKSNQNEFCVLNKNTKEEYWGEHANTYFGLTKDETIEVFTSEGYVGYYSHQVTPKMVANKLRQVISYQN